MKAIYIDFSRGESLQRVEVGYESDPDIVALHLQEGEHAWLHDISLGVEGELRVERRDGERYWYALPDWRTRQDYDDTPYVSQQPEPRTDPA